MEDNRLLIETLRKKVVLWKRRIDEYERIKRRLEASSLLLKALEEPVLTHGKSITAVQAAMKAFELTPRSVCTVDELIHRMRSVGWNTSSRKPREIIRTLFRRHSDRFERVAPNKYRIRIDPANGKGSLWPEDPRLEIGNRSPV